MFAGVIDGDTLLALLPLVQHDATSWHSLSHGYTPVYSLLITVHDQGLVLTCLAQGLARQSLRLLRLHPIDAKDPAMLALQQQLELVGFSCHRDFRFFNWVHHLHGQSFADYMAERPARLRNTIKRKQRKLQREHGYDIRLLTGDDAHLAMQDYHQVFNASWKANEQLIDLMDGLTQAFARRDWSRLAILYVDGRPIAVQLWFVGHGKANIFRLAYDQSWKDYSPGSILTQHLMRHAIDIDRVTEIDFLNGNEAYKQDWMSERRERWGLSCARQAPAQSKLRRLFSFAKMLRRT